MLRNLNKNKNAIPVNKGIAAYFLLTFQKEMLKCVKRGFRKG